MDPSTSKHSPFEIPHEDVDMLCQSHGFQVLRAFLARQTSFCDQHSCCSPQARDTWLLHRDILHALTMPVVELFNRASALAQAALCTHKHEDLELAFAADARGAFVWLQCFLGEEAEWCRTRGCPACVTMETLNSESHVRLTIAASLLSTASISSPNSSPATSNNSTPVTEDPPADTDASSGLTLPPLPHILPALRSALDKDPFWGPSYWPYLFARSTQLSAWIQALITSCVDLESLVASPVGTRRPNTTRSVTVPGVMVANAPKEQESGMQLKKSKLAKRQLRMKGEEMEIMRRYALQCWAKAAVPSQLRNEILGKDGRKRTLTCP